MKVTNISLNTSNPLPLLLVGLDKGDSPIAESIPNEWVYDPATQTTNMLDIIQEEQLTESNISCSGLWGDTTPTTTSSVANTTGVINTDSDESNDDKGTD